MPEREDDHLTSATHLLEKRREMAEVDQALAAQKEVLSLNRNPPKNYYSISYIVNDYIWHHCVPCYHGTLTNRL